MMTLKLSGIEACVFDAYGTLSRLPNFGGRSNCNTHGCAASPGTTQIFGR